VTRFLSADDVSALASHDVVMDAARAAVRAERDGMTVQPPRLDVDLPTGFLRVMPAAVGDVMGLKVMTLAKGLGTRYLVLVYAKESGALLAALDADEITRQRTAATTAVAGEILAPAGTDTLGLIGTGFEAEGHLRLLARVWPLRQVTVYSRSTQRRESFARRMTVELGVDVQACDSMSAAVSDAPISVLATKSTDPVVDGSAFPPGAVVLSIGSTRPDLRELDRESLRRARVLLVDDATQVRAESGDVIDGLACGALPPERIVPMADPDGALNAPPDGRDLLAFKSVGTAVHDLSLAVALLAAAESAGRGRELGELTRLKPFADAVASVVEGAS
jgi:ornithine cyclodeaminase/alanine dehydrogenase-like protein (mu-crystallin family)